MSSAQAREIAYDLYDFIIQGVKEMEEEEKAAAEKERLLEKERGTLDRAS